MPVYLITVHAYRSWREDHPKGYVQRGEGLKDPSRELAEWRAGHARDEEARFEGDVQELLHAVMADIAKEKRVRLHGGATCPTHVHGVFSFRSPACTCGAGHTGADRCAPYCEAHEYAEQVVVRMKRKMGQQVAKSRGTKRRRWFSRGWDVKRVKGRGSLVLPDGRVSSRSREDAGGFVQTVFVR